MPGATLLLEIVFATISRINADEKQEPGKAFPGISFKPHGSSVLSVNSRSMEIEF